MSERERIAAEIVAEHDRDWEVWSSSDLSFRDRDAARAEMRKAIATALRDERARALRRAEALANEHIKNARQTGEHTGSLELLRNRIGELASEETKP